MVLQVEDVQGAGNPLFLGADLPEDLIAGAYTLPPQAPGGTARLEFSEGRYASSDVDEPFNLVASEFPVTLKVSSMEIERAQLAIWYADGSQGWQYLVEGVSLEIDRPVNQLSIQVGLDPEEVPSDFVLEQNYPNPFNPTTTIRFGLPQEADVELAVFDALGRLRVVVEDALLTSGWHTRQFDASALPSGAYFYRLQTGSQVLTRAFMVVK
ncbi:MAG: T9SS type A sorting domain-containing protein [Rhodothermales bacterium]|nr:T9SS type A sorting domain-containing protein [Rhodothermales bacterium]